jgi:hypothetical protein
MAIRYKQIAIVDTEASLPATGVEDGQIVYCEDTEVLYIRRNTEWTPLMNSIISSNLVNNFAKTQTYGS